MLGTRVNGIVSSALRDSAGAAGPGGKWSKVLALASKVSHLASALYLSVVFAASSHSAEGQGARALMSQVV